MSVTDALEYQDSKLNNESLPRLRALGEILMFPQAFSFTEKSLADIINMTYSCHVRFAMICTERERL